MSEGFIKNEELLREDYRVDDLLDFSDIQNRFYERINKISGSSLIGLVGEYGAGKSTLLFQLSKKEENKENERWVFFDAWKFPERNNLWEGFVLDFVKSVNGELFKKIRSEIDGNKFGDWKLLVKTLAQGANIFYPGASLAENLSGLFHSSPARRVFEFQEILSDFIKKEIRERTIYIVVEDIDRSGDKGIFFLETLKQFISNSPPDKRLIIIVPMSTTSYETNIESYLKSIDYFEFFSLSDLKMEKFVSKVFNESLFEGSAYAKGSNKLLWTGETRKLQTISFLEALFTTNYGVSMRLLKLILRKANLIYKKQVDEGLEPDFRVTLCIEASKYITFNEEEKMKYFVGFKNSNSIPTGNVFYSFLAAIFANRDSIYASHYTEQGERKELLTLPHSFKFINRQGSDIDSYPSVPWEYGKFPNDKGFGITSFYKND